MLNRAVARPDKLDIEAYAEFRVGLLRHIGIEEKILLPAARRHRGGEPLPIAAKIRLDHGALVALMVPPPTRALVSTIRSILTKHNKLEEEVDGLYESAESTIGADAEEFSALMRQAAAVKVLPHNADPKVLETARRAV